MPMIDVYAAADLFPAGSDRQLGEELCMAILRAEGVATPGPFHRNNTAAYLHRAEPSAIQTAASACARTVRVQVVTPPAALTRAGQKQLVKEVTDIVTKISGDPTQAARTWVLLTEAAEGAGESRVPHTDARSLQPSRPRHGARARPMLGPPRPRWPGRASHGVDRAQHSSRVLQLAERLFPRPKGLSANEFEIFRLGGERGTF